MSPKNILSIIMTSLLSTTAIAEIPAGIYILTYKSILKEPVKAANTNYI